MQKKILEQENLIKSLKKEKISSSSIKTNSSKKLNFEDSKLRKFSSQGNLQKLMPRSQNYSSCYSPKKFPEENSQGIENLVTEISESEKKSIKFKEEYSDSDFFIQNEDMLYFLQCATSALEDCLN